MVKGEGKSGKVVDSIPSTSVYELNWVKTKPLNTSVNMIGVDVQIYIISIMHADVRWIGWLREKRREMSRVEFPLLIKLTFNS